MGNQRGSLEDDVVSAALIALNRANSSMVPESRRVVLIDLRADPLPVYMD